ncbi:hypothetical protein T484DRAFT_1954091 [Baffinella frigidus]|nr:hypothetical protein T484DRAFT_1954091 [Cryptophyta sp. CCMP2293]|mmetsp:Transcript_41778/g.99164  ORF Transcript_41778/g.99164 Transcript_41778/m.99164 type:complete len:319 (-) Transcript_41778:160-1116(-)
MLQWAKDSEGVAVVMYMLCSSTMLVANKIAVSMFPAQNLLLILQLGSSAAVVGGLGRAGWLDVDALEAGKLRRYWAVVAVFLLNIYTNMMALKSSNVETVIVFRSVTTVVVALGDSATLRGPSGLPSLPVMASLLSIVAFAWAFVAAERAEGMQVTSLFWPLLYVAAQSLDCLYIKHVVSTVHMTSWGRSYYNNLLAIAPLLVPWALSPSESVESLSASGALSSLAFAAVLLSCILGLCISVTAFHCRGMVSATSYSLIGNMNKVLTVLINRSVTSHHSTAWGAACLVGCLLSGYAYTAVQPSAAPSTKTEGKKSKAA